MQVDIELKRQHVFFWENLFNSELPRKVFEDNTHEHTNVIHLFHVH